MYLFQFSLSDSNTFPALSAALAKVLWLVPLFYCAALFWLLHPPSLFFHSTLVERLWPETLKLISEQFRQLGKVCLLFCVVLTKNNIRTSIRLNQPTYLPITYLKPQTFPTYASSKLWIVMVSTIVALDQRCRMLRILQVYPCKINSQSLEDMQVEYISQK